MNNFLVIAFLLLASGVIMGAFGAHALRDYFSGREEDIWKTAVFYQITHALGLLVLILLEKSQIISTKLSKLTSVLLIAGIVVFSSSLYLLVLSRIRILGAVTPIGGILMIASWSLLAYGVARQKG